MLSGRTYDSLSKRQRESTPLAFAEWLIYNVRACYRTDRLSVLWVRKRSIYHELLPADWLWDVDRDANTYTGPWPVICHPPCGPWGKFKGMSRESKHHGISALRLAERFGGVVEHPLGSSLFREHGRPGRVTRHKQGDYGHFIEKKTYLYWG